MTLTPWNRVTINCRPATAVTRFQSCIFEGSFILMTLSLCTFIFVVPQEDEEDYYLGGVEISAKNIPEL